MYGQRDPPAARVQPKVFVRKNFWGGRLYGGRRARHPTGRREADQAEQRQQLCTYKATHADVCGARGRCAGHGAPDALCHCPWRYVPGPKGYATLANAGNTYNIRNVAQREARIFFAQARHLTTPLTDVVHEGRTAFAHGTDHVHVEPAPRAALPPPAPPSESPTDDTSGTASSDSDDVDASSDYDDTRRLR